MKKFFLLLFFSFSFFGFSNCGSVPIASDICDLTTEICYYAQSICALFPGKALQKSQSQEIKTRILSAKNNLMNLHTDLNTLQKSLNPETEQYFKEELLRIRDQLKLIYEERKDQVTE